MSTTNDLLSILTCSHCNKIYERPVILPCKNTICRDDLLEFLTDSSANDARTYQCPFCAQLHAEPLRGASGFQEDTRLMKIIQKLDLTNSSSESLKQQQQQQAAHACHKFDRLHKEFKHLLKHPHAFIEEFFHMLKLQIESNRRQNLEIVNNYYDHVLNEAIGLESVCKSDLNSDETFLLHNQKQLHTYEKRVSEWLAHDSQSKSGDKTRVEHARQEAGELLESSLELRIKNLKANLLGNRNVNFEERLLSSNVENLFGKLNVSRLSRAESEKDYSNLRIVNSSQMRNSSRERTLDEYEDEIIGSKQSPLSSKFTLSNSDEELDIENKSKSISLTRSDAARFHKKTKSKNLYIVVFDYEAKTKEELTIKKGDILRVNDSDKSKHGVWMATIHERSNRPGSKSNSSSTPQYITRRKSMFEVFSRQNSTPKLCASNSSSAPSSSASGLVFSTYLDDYSQIENEPWFFGRLNRAESEFILKCQANSSGSFLVRMCDAKLGAHIYSLSVRDETNEIRHYKIVREHCGHDASQYHIHHANAEQIKRFSSLADLIAYYRANRAGLCSTLNSTCCRDILS